MMNGTLNQVQGWVKVKGTTDGTNIGNVGDALKVSATSIVEVDAGNSTSTPLGISGVFTGAWVEVLNHTNISVLVFADKNSATDGLVIEFSSDGVNVDDSDRFTISANAGKTYSFGVTSRYVRVKYTNDGIAQTIFRLQTLHHPFAPKPSSHRINDSIIDQDDAELVKAVITGKMPSGAFTNVQVTTNGNLKTSLEELDPAIEGAGVNLPVKVVPISTSGNLTALSSSLIYDNTTKGMGALGIQITGTWSGTIAASVSLDGDTYVNISVHNIVSGVFTSSTNANGIFTINLGGLRYVKLTMTAYTSGTADITYFGTTAKSQAETVNITQNTSAAGVSNQTRVPTIETEHQKIHEGKMFHCAIDNTLANNGTWWLLFTPSSATAHFILNLFTNGKVDMHIYENPTITTVTTSYPLYNRNRGSSTTTTATLQLVTAKSANGTELTDLLFGSSGGNNSSTQIGRAQEWDLPTAKTYLIELTSLSSANDITFWLDFYEN